MQSESLGCQQYEIISTDMHLKRVYISVVMCLVIDFVLKDNLSIFFFAYCGEVCRYESQLERFCEFMDPLLDSPTPETLQGISSLSARMKNKLEKSAFWAHCLRQAISLGQKDMV